jgi:hypothetical protein
VLTHYGNDSKLSPVVCTQSAVEPDVLALGGHEDWPWIRTAGEQCENIREEREVLIITVAIRKRLDEINLE